jgi:predicted  nucleic acid-binding Zn-ribbon protein
MPHQCVRCSTIFPNGAQEILKGCSCGARLFFFVKDKDIQRGKEIVSNLSEDDKIQIEQDIREIIPVKDESNKDAPVILDIEAIRIMGPGKYELDIVHMMKNDPMVIKLEEGKYMIDLPQAFSREDKD